MDEVEFYKNQHYDPKISVLSYNVLYSTILDQNGTNEHVVKLVNEEGKVELHLKHGMMWYHHRDLFADFSDGRYSKTISLDMLNDVKKAVMEDDIEYFCNDTSNDTAHQFEENFKSYLKYGKAKDDSEDNNEQLVKGNFRETIQSEMLSNVKGATGKHTIGAFGNNKSTGEGGVSSKKSNYEEDIQKLKKYYRLYEESFRYSLLEKRLGDEIQKNSAIDNDFHRPIICLHEVTRKWHGKLRIFFTEHDYKVHFLEDDNKPENDNEGLLIAYPSEKYYLLEIYTGVPYKDFESPPKIFICELKKQLEDISRKSMSETGSVFPDYSEKELSEIFDYIICESRNPFMFAKFKVLPFNSKTRVAYPAAQFGKKSDGDGQNLQISGASMHSKQFVIGSYHMNSALGSPSGPMIMATYAFGIRWYFELFLRGFAPSVRKAANVILVGDFNTLPRTVGFQYLMNGKFGDPAIDPNCSNLSNGILKNDKCISDCIIKSLFGSNGVRVQKLLAEFNLDGPKYEKLTWRDIADGSLDLEHVYNDFVGHFPDMTTKTQQFLGTIDHIFKAVENKEQEFILSNEAPGPSLHDNKNDVRSIKGLETLNVKLMPTVKQMEGKSFPNLENEPSDHLCQGAVFKFR